MKTFFSSVLLCIVLFFTVNATASAGSRSRSVSRFRGISTLRSLRDVRDIHDFNRSRSRNFDRFRSVDRFRGRSVCPSRGFSSRDLFLRSRGLGY